MATRRRRFRIDLIDNGWLVRVWVRGFNDKVYCKTVNDIPAIICKLDLMISEELEDV